MSAIPLRFAVYENVNSAVICLAHDERSTIVYCNRFFADLLRCKQSDLIGRSLDEVSTGTRPHSQASASDPSPIGRKMRGGLLVGAIIQGGARKGEVIKLNVYRIEAIAHPDGDYRLGYCRAATDVERFVDEARVGSRFDRRLKPLAQAAVAGARPFLTALLLAALPELARHLPLLARFIELLLSR